MAVITAQNIIDKAEFILNDEDNVRWTTSEMLGWINSAQREILIIKPNANPVFAAFTTVAGTRQDVAASPYYGTMILDVVRNTNGSAINVMEQTLLNKALPSWHTLTAATARNYMVNPLTPTTFYLYPPSPGSASIDIVYSKIPTDVATLAGTIFNDLYETVILDYVLYRAFSKDAESAASAQRAVAHYQMFMTALTGKGQGEVTFSPATPPPAAQ